MSNRRDLLTRDGAEDLASRLRTFWFKCPEVTVQVEEVSITEKTGKRRRAFVVRTNLIGGMPPRAFSLSQLRHEGEDRA
jgi:hypothetical protein